MVKPGELTEPTDHFDRQSAFCLLRIFVKFHVTALHGRVLVSVHSSSEDRQKRLGSQIRVSFQTLEGTHLEKNLTIESISRGTTARRPDVPTDIERVGLKEWFLLTDKRGKRRLGRIEGAKSKLHIIYQQVI